VGINSSDDRQAPPLLLPLFFPPPPSPFPFEVQDHLTVIKDDRPQVEDMLKARIVAPKAFVLDPPFFFLSFSLSASKKE